MLESVVDEMPKGGFLVGLSSVAGDRGRQRRVFGFPGWAVQASEEEGMRVFTVKLGFVDTAMTYRKQVCSW